MAEILTYKEWSDKYGIDEEINYCDKCLSERLNEDMACYWDGDDYFINCRIAEGKSNDTCEYVESHLEDMYREYLSDNGIDYYDEETIKKYMEV